MDYILTPHHRTVIDSIFNPSLQAVRILFLATNAVMDSIFSPLFHCYSYCHVCCSRCVHFNISFPYYIFFYFVCNVRSLTLRPSCLFWMQPSGKDYRNQLTSWGMACFVQHPKTKSTQPCIDSTSLPRMTTVQSWLLPCLAGSPGKTRYRTRSLMEEWEASL